MSENDTNSELDDVATAIETYSDLFEAFLHGATAGSHRKLHIEQDGNRTLLVAYDTWVYAEREQGSGQVTFYEAFATDDATNASNLQAGRLRKKLDAMSVFHQVALQERVEQGLPTVDGETYSTFKVERTP